ncbi:MAG TPA: DUF6714 family protein [Leptolyngbyaceae cyanobacterium]
MWSYYAIAPNTIPNDKMSSENRYPCPCCGYKTLDAKPPGTYLICPICFWEDNEDMTDEYEYNWSSSNQVSLRQAQRNFIEFGACEQHWLNDVRAPTVDDVRDSNWEIIDVLAEKARLTLIEKINAAFKDVTLEDGVSLHQARARDDYEDEWLARQIDREVRWQEIPDSWIKTFHDVFSFMDAKGFRHAIPAYMLWCLKPNKSNTNSFWATTYYLRQNSNPLFELFNETQLQVISEFLDFIDIFPETFTALS